MSAVTGALRFVRTAAPLYRDIELALERALREGVWKPGEQIPTEAELERQLGASRGTLRIAISELVRKGLLHRQAGRGTFVLGPEFRTLDRFFRYERLGSESAIVPSLTVLDQQVVAADARTATALRIDRGSEVGYVRRLRHHDEEPFQLVDSFFQMDVWRQVAGADFGAHPLYDVFKDAFALYIIHADEFLRADVATTAEAALLAIRPRKPVIRLERIAYTFESRPVEYRRSVGRSDKFHYHVRLR